MNMPLAWVATAVVALIAVVAPIGAAQAATAKTLPTGISMYVFDQAGRGIYESDATGVLTKTNAVLGENFTDIQTGAFNYGTKTLWTVDNGSLHFGSIDLVTGVTTDLGVVSYGSDSLESAYGLDFVDATNAKLLIYNNNAAGGAGAWGIFDMDIATGVLSNPLYLTLGSVDPYGLAIDFANGGAMYIDTSEDSIKLVNSSDGTVGPDLADPNSLTPANDFIWDGKFDSNGVFWTMSANCCQEEESGYIFTYKTGDADWAYQGTTSQDVSGPLAVGTSTSALQPLADTGASVMLVVALSVSGVALVGLGFAGVMISRRRKA